MATKLSQKTTIYLEPNIKKFIQLMSLQQNKTISLLINDRFEYQMRKFESSKNHKGKTPPAVAEWKIVKNDFGKKFK